MKNNKSFFGAGLIGLAITGFFGSCNEKPEEKNNFVQENIDDIKYERVKFSSGRYNQMFEFVRKDCRCPAQKNLDLLGAYELHFKSDFLVCLYSDKKGKMFHTYESKDNGSFCIDP